MAQFVASELKSGEVFLANTDNKDYLEQPDMKHLKTMRLGTQALCINGTKHNMEHCRPIFIHKSEYDAYNRVMQARFEKIMKL